MASKLDQWRDLIHQIKEIWRLLPIRRWINNNPRIIIRITVISIFLLLIVIISLLMPEDTVTVQGHKKAWFYDLNTGRLFIARSDAVPPIKAPSGPLPDGSPAGVRAYVFSYTAEPNKSDLFIGFLETADPASKDGSYVSANIKSGGYIEWGKGRLIRKANAQQWHPADSSEGQAILKEILLAGKNDRSAIYYPPP